MQMLMLHISKVSVTAGKEAQIGLVFACFSVHSALADHHLTKNSLIG